MITPTSSPTKYLDSGFETLKTNNKTSEMGHGRLNNLKPKVQDEGVFHLDYDADLDLNSIEGDLF